MSDAFGLLRKQLLADMPSLKKYAGKGSSSRDISRSPKQPPSGTNLILRQGIRQDPDAFRRVPPQNANDEHDVFEHRGKKYKLVQYGRFSHNFLIDKGLNPKTRYSTDICSNKLSDLKNKNSLLMAARESAMQEALKLKNTKGNESEARRQELRNMTTYKSTVVDDLVKHNRAKTGLILKNAKRALTDQLEEMRDFLSYAGKTQVLAMRELQIEDKKVLKGENYSQNSEDKEKGRPSEYQEMLDKNAALTKKNRQIVSIMKNQALEKDMIRDLEIEENYENALRLDALAEAELEKRMKEKEADDRARQKHFDTFTAIAEYKDTLRGIRVAEDQAIWQREKDWLDKKAKFNEAYQTKMDKIKEDKRRLVNAVTADLSATYEKREQEEMEYYYTLQKERDIQMEDQEAQDKLNKRVAMEELMKDWAKITEANKLIKQQQMMQENEERERMLKFIELENNVKRAEEKKRQVEKDINRMEILYQINEKEKRREEEAEAKAREATLLRAERFVREGEIKDRMRERIEEFKDNGLPERFLSNIRRHCL